MVDVAGSFAARVGLRPPEPALALLPGQIDLWVAAVREVPEAALANQFEQVLSEQERRQHGKFVFEKDRRRYAVTRSLVRYVLSRYLPIQPAQWRFEATAFGRPFIANDHPGVPGLTFNLSHSDQWVVLALTRDGRLGVDVEELAREVPVEIADNFFSAAEIGQLRALPPALQPRRFLELWTLKESYIKARGQGLSLPLDQFGFQMSPHLEAWFDAGFGDSPHHWTFWQWSPSPASIAALCAENRPGHHFAVSVRRTIPFASEEMTGFEVLRMSSR